jgi:hypothetical protein
MNKPETAGLAKEPTAPGEKSKQSAPWTVNADGTVTVLLKRSIETHGGVVSKLTLKEPTGDTFFRYGPPYDTVVQATDAGEVRSIQTNVKAPLVLKYLAACTDLDEGVLEQMSAFDCTRCGNAIVSVFFNDAGN